MLTTSFNIIANEFRAWLLHYSIPVLRGILPSVYLNHYCLLVWAIFTLLGDEIPIEDVNQSQKLIADFVWAIPTLYCKYYKQLLYK